MITNSQYRDKNRQNVVEALCTFPNFCESIIYKRNSFRSIKPTLFPASNINSPLAFYCKLQPDSYIVAKFVMLGHMETNTICPFSNRGSIYSLSLQ